MNARKLCALLSLVLSLVLAAGLAFAREPQPEAPLTAVFTYQGRLTSSDVPYTGLCDLQFGLWDTLSGGTQVGPTQTILDVGLTDGYFTVLLDWGADKFFGEQRWLEIHVRCPAGSGAYTPLTPRQQLTASPYSLFAMSAPWPGLQGVPPGFADGVDNDTTYTAGMGLILTDTILSADTSVMQQRVIGACGGGFAIRQVNQDGSVTCEPVGGGGGDAWLLTGNSGTTPDVHFLGTTDNAALVFRVNNERALRLEPNATSPNVIGGYAGNWAYSGVYGASIGGGGESTYDNVVTDAYGAIGGGAGNQAGDAAGTTDDAMYATVGGGSSNSASGPHATIGGGSSNSASGPLATIGGGWFNSTSADVATVGGGYHNTASAYSATVGGGHTNTASEWYTTVGGGWSNTASAESSTIGGGSFNSASGFHATVGGGYTNTASEWYTTVGGGYLNSAGATGATVGGGESNSASAASATVGGGESNSASGLHATVGGGFTNTASLDFSTVGGGWGNTASGSATIGYTTVGGGYVNTASGAVSTIGGGQLNTAGGDGATVGGGESNSASGQSATVSGGYTNTATAFMSTIGGGYYNIASGEISTIGGGYHNLSSWTGTTVAGGEWNTAGGDGAMNATVSGGYHNIASGARAAIGGGEDNTASGEHATIGGGDTNTAGGSESTIGGGQDNTAGGTAATVPGGVLNSASGDYSFAAGRRAKAYYDGCFVWGDSTDDDLNCATVDRWLARASGGVYFYTNSTLTAYAYLAPGSSTWASGSDRNLKENVAEVDSQQLLARLAQVPVTTWNYTSQDPSIRHMGPMAQDFYAAFGVGEDDTHITTVDADGVALAAIQGLYAQNQALQAQNADLEARVSALEQALQGGRPARSGTRLPVPWLLAGGLVVAGGGVVAGRRRLPGGRR